MRGSLSHSDSEKLVTEIEGLRRLSPEELDQRWGRLFESERPNRMCGSLLRQALAYRLQEKVLGGLKASTRRLLQQIATNGTTRSPAVEPPIARLKTGTVLIREWHGTTHRITALEKGFLLGGKRYRSLSEIARAITGTRWSGPLFFGLKSSVKEQSHGAE
jgi:hypothetical protein